MEKRVQLKKCFRQKSFKSILSDAFVFTTRAAAWSSYAYRSACCCSWEDVCLSYLVPAFEPDTENDSVWVSYFLTTPLQGCVRMFLNLFA